ncbi:MAG: hypothetical protein ACUVWR_18090 [Anaerolineae bacterium]
MIIRSEWLTEGLFGQAFVWMLEVLPYLHARGWKPAWEIRSKNYGEPPEFNIFPGIIQTTYRTEATGDVLCFEQLQSRHKFNFRHDFQAARRLWGEFFRFPDDVYRTVGDFWQAHFADRTVLGLHYRGTDKNLDPWQTNPVTRYQFLCAVEDFLDTHPDVNAIFLATDDAHFLDAASRLPHVRYYSQERSADGRPLWNAHGNSRNRALAKEAIVDCLTLARCRYALKCMSQLSAFSKVINPDLEIYRVSACKLGWFPEAYVPLYRASSKAARALLAALQQDDYQAPLYARVAGIHRRTVRIVRQLWHMKVHGVPTRSLRLRRQRSKS